MSSIVTLDDTIRTQVLYGAKGFSVTFPGFIEVVKLLVVIMTTINPKKFPVIIIGPHDKNKPVPSVYHTDSDRKYFSKKKVTSRTKKKTPTTWIVFPWGIPQRMQIQRVRARMKEMWQYIPNTMI